MSRKLIFSLSGLVLLAIATVVLFRSGTEKVPAEATTDHAKQPRISASERSGIEGMQRRKSEYAVETRSTRETGQKDFPVIHSALGIELHKVRADEFALLLDAYDSFSRGTIAAFSERYRGAVAFGSQKEFDWLASNGYPLPEEILAAASMSLEDLRALAARGDAKAELLYFDRLNQEIVRARSSHIGSGLTTDSLAQDPDYAWMFVEADKYRARLADNTSPFSGFLLARFYEQALGNPYAAAGALYLSGLRGDHVAMAAAESLVREYQMGDETRDAVASFALVMQDLGIGRRVSPRPGLY